MGRNLVRSVIAGVAYNWRAVSTEAGRWQAVNGSSPRWFFVIVDRSDPSGAALRNTRDRAISASELLSRRYPRPALSYAAFSMLAGIYARNMRDMTI